MLPQNPETSTSTPEPSPSSGRRSLPLAAQVALGAVLGAVLGEIFRTRPIVPGLTPQQLGEVGLLVIKLLKALAVPLVFFAILDAFVRTRIRGTAALRLIAICLVNVSVAMTIGLTILNVFRPGEAWRGHIEQLTSQVRQTVGTTLVAPTNEKATLDPLKNLSGYIPDALIQPFSENNIIGVVLLAVLAGAAIRRVGARAAPGGEAGIHTLQLLIEATYEVLQTMLEWVVRAVPFAVFGAVASVVGKSGLEIFGVLWIFLAAVLSGLAIHALVYYPLAAWVVGRRSPRRYLGGGADAILTGLSTNSSLVTVPITLKCLTERMGISASSARLAACVGTNLNNDGITLYEAMAALFLAQAIGMELDLGQQLVVIAASIMAGVGVAGVPEAGLVVLPLVLGAAGLPPAIVLAAIPLILPVDWIIARCRSGVNVMSDMLVAILLDATDPEGRTRDGYPAEPRP